MLEDAIQRLNEGIVAGEIRAYAKNVSACGLRGSLKLDVYINDDGLNESHLLTVAAYCGRRPHYYPWIELFCIENDSLGTVYYDSELENTLLQVLADSLGPGARVFIEYYSDKETSFGLTIGLPPAVTRQGYKLFNLGFTWFKDWYFSEGGHEGGQKLQGEKSIDDKHRKRQIKWINNSIKKFLEESEEKPLPCYTVQGSYDWCIQRARTRGEMILDNIDYQG